MQITWYGKNCFRVITTPAKNHPVNVLIDPLPKMKADIILSSSPISTEAFLINGPGEYEVEDVFFQGINSIWTIEAEGIRICYLDNFSQDELGEKELEKIGQIDILMFPASAPIKVLSQIEPKITIPMLEAAGDLDKFLKTLGIKKIEPIPKLVVKKKDLLTEEAKIVVLKK